MVDAGYAKTADSILLYVGHHPIFVLAAYTRRVRERHDAIHPKRRWLVQLGKHYCSKQNPKCEVCPWGPMLKRRRAKSRV